MCRRKMVHLGCGHLVTPRDATTAPPINPAHEISEQCLRCRWEAVAARTLRLECERLRAQQDALRRDGGFQLPMFVHSTLPSTGSSVEDRIAELEENFYIANELSWKEFEEREGRETW